VVNGFFELVGSGPCRRRLNGFLFLVGLGLLVFSGRGAEAQDLRIDVGGGWGFPTKNLELETTVDGPPQSQASPLFVDLKSNRQVYAGVGFVRSIAEKFELGARVRGHTTRIGATCPSLSCGDAGGRLRVAAIEGRIILTSPGWIHPYVLVGLGVVHTSLDAVTVEDRTYSDVSVVDAGGDVGIGATVPVVGGLKLDAEIRAAGSLPGGKENAVTVAPFTLGIAYRFQ